MPPPLHSSVFLTLVAMSSSLYTLYLNQPDNPDFEKIFYK